MGSNAIEWTQAKIDGMGAGAKIYPRKKLGLKWVHVSCKI